MQKFEYFNSQSLTISVMDTERTIFFKRFIKVSLEIRTLFLMLYRAICLFSLQKKFADLVTFTEEILNGGQ